jgi:hypothetical protein
MPSDHQGNNHEHKKLLAYRLIDANVFRENASVLGETLFPGSSADADQTFGVSPLSGWISYADDRELFKDRQFQTLAATAEEARSIAAKFIAAANARVAASDTLRQAGVPPPFPSRLSQAGTTLMWRHGQHQPDHWLCRYQISLLSSHGFGAEAAPLWGAGLDVRVGNGGRVVGLSLRFRAPSGTLESEQIDPPSHDQHDDRQTAAATIVYRSEGEAALQTHYLPYYVSGTGHHSGFAAASKLSFGTGILESFDNEGADLSAIVEGGSGSFDFEWGYWRVDDEVLAFVDAGRSDSIRVGVGIYNVILNTTDRRTGVAMQTQSTVYARGGAGAPALV